MQCLPPGHSRNWYAFLRVLVKLAPHDETINNEATNVTLKLWPKGINEAVLRGGKMVCYSPIMVVRLIGKRGVAFDAKHCVLATFESPKLAFDMLRMGDWRRPITGCGWGGIYQQGSSTS